MLSRSRRATGALSAGARRPLMDDESSPGPADGVLLTLPARGFVVPLDTTRA
jgi:hypothetical protein